LVGCNEAGEFLRKQPKWICVRRFHKCFLVRESRFAEAFKSRCMREAVNRWLLQSESTLEARPCTTGNTASR
jgi:hypothetical protein